MMSLSHTNNVRAENQPSSIVDRKRFFECTNVAEQQNNWWGLTTKFCAVW